MSAKRRPVQYVGTRQQKYREGNAAGLNPERFAVETFFFHSNSFLDQRANIMTLLSENQNMEHDQLIKLANSAVLNFK
jgi:hypothetical protein